MQLETGFPSSHQLKSYVASKSRLKLAARAVLSADAGLLVIVVLMFLWASVMQLCAFCNVHVTSLQTMTMMIHYRIVSYRNFMYRIVSFRMFKHIQQTGAIKPGH